MVWRWHHRHFGRCRLGSRGHLWRERSWHRSRFYLAWAVLGSLIGVWVLIRSHLWDLDTVSIWYTYHRSNRGKWQRLCGLIRHENLIFIAWLDASISRLLSDRRTEQFMYLRDDPHHWRQRSESYQSLFLLLLHILMTLESRGCIPFPRPRNRKRKEIRHLDWISILSSWRERWYG